ncbi:hypothetical protein [Synechococcus sp. MIT S1220]
MITTGHALSRFWWHDHGNEQLCQLYLHSGTPGGAKRGLMQAGQ